ncbi:hypothetical protein [Streptomyces antibioticus]|uniref:hypothetical protein n=1 Tax=Streptomyces antibioticus TaxID=1890 RepID=UPI003D7354C5
MAESERAYIREKFLEGQASARERGRHGGRPKVVDGDMADYARSLRAGGVPVPEIARNLVITSGKNQANTPRPPPATASSPRMSRTAEQTKTQPRSTHCAFGPYLGDSPAGPSGDRLFHE